jgi:hypothetical protein
MMESQYPRKTPETGLLELLRLDHTIDISRQRSDPENPLPQNPKKNLAVAGA